MTRHELKTWPKYFAAVRSGQKRFEIRRNDRDFKVGDILVLREFDPEDDAYTGQAEERHRARPGLETTPAATVRGAAGRSQRDQARAASSAGHNPGCRAARYSAIASESHTTVSPSRRHGTLPEGENERNAA